MRLVKYIRATHPDTPIMLTAGTTYGDHWVSPASNDLKRAALKAEYDKLVAADGSDEAPLLPPQADAPGEALLLPLPAPMPTPTRMILLTTTQSLLFTTATPLPSQYPTASRRDAPPTVATLCLQRANSQRARACLSITPYACHRVSCRSCLDLVRYCGHLPTGGRGRSGRMGKRA